MNIPLKERIYRVLTGIACGDSMGKITSKYVQTQDVASDLVKDAQNIRTEIGKINHNAKNNLKLKGRLIESKQSSGYKLNPQFKIIPSK